MIYVFVWALFCVWLAWDNKKRIDENKKIYHALNGGLHVLAAVCVWLSCGWNYGMAVLFTSRLVFDIALNLFRGLGIAYISPSPASVIDKIEKKVVLLLAEKVFTHEEAGRAVELSSLTIKGFLLIKIVFLFLL